MNDKIKMTALTNIGCMAAGCFAISVACKVTKSGWPLLALLLIPRFCSCQEQDQNKEVNENE